MKYWLSVAGLCFCGMVALGTLRLATSAQDELLSQKLEKDSLPLDKEHTAIFLTPILVVEGTVIDMEWHPSGRYALSATVQFGVLQKNAPPIAECALWLWDHNTEQRTRLWSRKWDLTEWYLSGRSILDFVRIQQIAWSQKTPEALILAQFLEGEDRVSRLFYVNAERRTCTEIAQGEWRAVFTHPNFPCWLVEPFDPTAERSALVVERGGHAYFIESTNLPENAYFEGWAPDQLVAYYQVYHFPSAGSDPRKTRFEYLAFSLRTRQVSSLGVHEITGDIKAVEEARKSARPNMIRSAPMGARLSQSLETLSIEAEPATLKIGDSLHSLKHTWITSTVDGKTHRYLLGEGITTAFFLPNGDGVGYLRPEGAFVLKMVRIPNTYLTELREQRLQTLLTMQAKQIGLAMLMYATDYDENFPQIDLSSHDVMEVTMPYLKDRHAFYHPETGEFIFHYVNRTTALAEIERPAETVIGYLETPRGRAVIYADGHVRWEPHP